MTRRYRTALVVCLGTCASLGIPPAVGAQTFSNPTPITIPGSGTGSTTGAPATPYPSNITVAGLTAPIARVSITLKGFSHAFPDDVDILLVAPDGARLVVLSDVGASNTASSLNITVNDQASSTLPDAATLASAAYRPANFGTVVDPFPAPAPAFTSADSPTPGGVATFASRFGGHDGNGIWSLYVVDDAEGDIGAIAGGWSITFAPATTVAAGALQISEFRLRGPGGAQDEFIEIYNASGADHIVSGVAGTGYGIAASDGVTRCSIPNGTMIPNRGHFLCVNSTAYSLSAYAGGDVGYTTDIPDNAGIAIFNNNLGGGSYSLATRLDAAGSTTEASAVYKEGAGYPALSPFIPELAWVRKTVGQCLDPTCAGGSFFTAVSMAAIQDTNSNASDFYFTDTFATSAGAGQRLGAPGPENLTSPIKLDGAAAQLLVQKASGCSAWDAAPNRVRDFTSDPANNSTFGTLSLRMQWKNVSGANITRLRFRIIDLTTFPAPSGYADLRPRTSVAVSITADGYPCGTGTSGLSVLGTTLEQPPSQPNGSGFNGSLSAGTITIGTPLANNATVTTQLLLGIQQTGSARFCVIPETLPAVVGDPFCYIGNTEGIIVPAPIDYDYDQRPEMPMYNQGTGEWKLLRSGSGYTAQTSIFWGGPDYIPVPGDYDGDGKGDAAVYKMSTGVWSILTSRSSFTRAFNVTLGGPGFTPEPGDYDGDGTTDLSVAGATAAVWAFKASSTNFTTTTSRSWAAPGYTSVPGQDFDGDDRSDMVAYNENTGMWLVLRSSTDFSSSFTRAWGGHGYTLVPGDYNGDAIADFGVYRRVDGLWTVLLSPGYTTTFTAFWGREGFLPMPADYDGDQKIDPAYYQPSTNKWMVLKSTTAYSTVLQATYGSATDLPLSTAVVPNSAREIHGGDFDGDAISDVTVYNGSTAVWSTLTSSSGFTGATNRPWGGAGYTPVPGDYDGDGMGDLAVYHQASGMWFVLRSDSNFTTSYVFDGGGPGYIPVQGDYDGDGRTDMIVYNTTTGLWYGRKSSSNFTTTLSITWGGTGYTAAPGDYDGDGKADLMVYQATPGRWLALKSSTTYTTSLIVDFGGPSYQPIPADFDGDGITDICVYQSSSGVWTMLKSSAENLLGFTITYGGPAYTPVPGDFDGDGRADIAVYNQSGSFFSILQSRGNYATSLMRFWGGPGYTAMPQFQ
jgi:subtilisin-like proprotein convertase family protein